MLKGIVSSAEKDIVRIPMKGKNLIPYPYSTGTQSYDGITWTMNTDGRLTGEGISTNGTNYYIINRQQDFSLKKGDYTLSFQGTKNRNLILRDTTAGINLARCDGTSKEASFTLSEDSGTLQLYFNTSVANVEFDIDGYPMLNLGSTALPYEPYGYQEGWEVRDNQDRLIWGKNNTVQGVPPVPFRGFGVPLESLTVSGNGVQNGTPTPDNILPFDGTGEQTWIKGLIFPLCGIGTHNDSVDLATGVVTRVISKIVFTGEESWNLQSINQYGIANFRTIITDRSSATENDCICTHFYPQTTYIADTKVDGIYINTSNTCHLRINSSIASTVEEMTAWLTAQYQNGTPVTVWYVAATPTTEHVSVTAGSTGAMTGFLIQTTNPVPTAPVTPVSNGTLQPNGTYDIFAGNLFDKVFTPGYHLSSQGKPTAYTNNGRCATLEPIDVSGVNIVTFSFTNTIQSDTKKYMYSLFDSSTLIERVANQESGNTIDVSQGNKLYLCVYSSLASVNAAETTTDIMLNLGVTALPYEPYGWKVPVTVCGENLWHSDTFTSSNLATNNRWSYGGSGTVHRCPCKPSTTYTMSFSEQQTSPVFRIATVDSDDYPYSGHQVAVHSLTKRDSVPEFITFTTTEEAEYILVQGSDPTKIMLVEGSAPAPYEPYHAPTAIPLYLGTNPTLRRIKKLVLTGEETITHAVVAGHNRFTVNNMFKTADYRIGVCSHYNYAHVNANNTVYHSSVDGSLALYILDDKYAEVSDFKSYLAQQYAAETPVTVWYVLVDPETGIVNEPLCKIGDYADELTVGSGIIPIAKGTNTLSVDTTLAPYNVTINGHIKYTYWGKIREDVRSGLAQTKFPVGTILYDNEDETTGTAFQVVGYDKHFDPSLTARGYTHSMTLCQLKLSGPWQFDASEAFLYVEQEMEPATYRIRIPDGYDDTNGGNGRSYLFTTTKTIPVGGQITLSWPSNSQPASISTYSSSISTTALDSSKSLTLWDESTEAVFIGTIKYDNNTDDSVFGKLNQIQRVRYGSNNYYQSSLRQLLNTSLTSGNWWHPTTIFDRPYVNRETNGYLRSLNGDFINVLATPEITYIANNKFEYPSLDGRTFTLNTEYKINTDKVFLLSHTEVGLSASPNIGTILDYYSTHNTNTDRIKYRLDDGNAYYWWFRTSYPTLAYVFRFCYASGALSISSANVSLGVAPACIIQ